MSAPATTSRGARGGFTLLEVMMATGILVVSLVILVETQSTAAHATFEADRILTATQLAQEKIAEVRMQVEYEGFTDQDVHEEGDFDDFGDEALNLQMDDLDQYHWEFLVTEVDLDLGGDLAASAQSMLDGFGAPAEAHGREGDQSAAGDAMGLIGQFMSPDVIKEALNPLIREVRVRVWWGDDLDEAEELGNEVILTTHVIQPNGSVLNAFGGRGSGTAQNPYDAGTGQNAAWERGRNSPGQPNPYQPGTPEHAAFQQGQSAGSGGSAGRGVQGGSPRGGVGRPGAVPTPGRTPGLPTGGRANPAGGGAFGRPIGPGGLR